MLNSRTVSHIIAQRNHPFRIASVIAFRAIAFFWMPFWKPFSEESNFDMVSFIALYTANKIRTKAIPVSHTPRMETTLFSSYSTDCHLSPLRYVSLKLKWSFESFLWYVTYVYRSSASSVSFYKISRIHMLIAHQTSTRDRTFMGSEHWSRYIALNDKDDASHAIGMFVNSFDPCVSWWNRMLFLPLTDVKM